MTDEVNNDSLLRDNSLSDFTDQLLSEKNPNNSEIVIDDADIFENQKLVQRIFLVGEDGIPSKEISAQIRKTLEAEWKAKWPSEKKKISIQGLLRSSFPEKAGWKSTRQRQVFLARSMVVITIVVLAAIFIIFPDGDGELTGAANQGGVAPILIFSLLVIGLGLWWFRSKKR